MITWVPSFVSEKVRQWGAAREAAGRNEPYAAFLLRLTELEVAARTANATAAASLKCTRESGWNRLPDHGEVMAFMGARTLQPGAAPDAEAVRSVQRESGAPFDTIWAGISIAPGQA